MNDYFESLMQGLQQAAEIEKALKSGMSEEEVERQFGCRIRHVSSVDKKEKI